MRAVELQWLAEVLFLLKDRINHDHSFNVFIEELAQLQQKIVISHIFSAVLNI